LGDFQSIVVQLGLEINRLTDVTFSGFIEIIRGLLGPPFVAPEVVTQEVAPFVRYGTIGREALKVSRGPITGSELKFPEVLIFEAYLKRQDHPIKYLLEFLNKFPESLRFVAIQVIAELGIDEMVDGNLNLQALAFLLMNSLQDQMRLNLAHFIDSMSARLLFFSPTTFNPGVTIFTDPMSPLIPLRLFILRVFESFLDFKDLRHFTLWIFEFIGYLTEWPEMFAEFFFFAKQILSRIVRVADNNRTLLKYASDIILIQQAAYYAGCKNARALRSLTFTTLFELLEKGNGKEQFEGHSYPILGVLIDLLYETDVTEWAGRFLERFFQMWSSEGADCVHPLFEPVIAELFAMTNEYGYAAKTLLVTLRRVIELMPKTQLNVLRHDTDFFLAIQKSIFEKNYQEDTVIAALKLLRFLDPRDPNMNWAAIGTAISKLQMNKDLYVTLLSILSQDQKENFSSIANFEATVVIDFLLNSEFRESFLKKLQELCRSVPQCFIFSKIEVPKKIILLLFEHEDLDIVAPAISVLQKILAEACDRSSFCTLFRLLNSDRPLCQHLLDMLLSILRKPVTTIDPFLYVTAQFGRIELPALWPQDYPRGFSLLFSLMFGPFPGDKEAIQLFHFCGKTTFLTAVLRGSKIVLTSKLYHGRSPMTIDLHVPENRWFTLSLGFEALNSVLVSVEGNEVGGGLISSDPWTEPFTDCVLFGGSHQHSRVECQFAKFAIYHSNEVVMFGQCEPLILLVPKKHNETTMINTSNLPDDSCEYDGLFFQFPRTFWQIFQDSHGVA
jgi:hypothetical protein